MDDSGEYYTHPGLEGLRRRVRDGELAQAEIDSYLSALADGQHKSGSWVDDALLVWRIWPDSDNAGDVAKQALVKDALNQISVAMEEHQGELIAFYRLINQDHKRSMHGTSHSMTYDSVATIGIGLIKGGVKSLYGPMRLELQCELLYSHLRRANHIFGHCPIKESIGDAVDDRSPLNYTPEATRFLLHSARANPDCISIPIQDLMDLRSMLEGKSPATRVDPSYRMLLGLGDSPFSTSITHKLAIGNTEVIDLLGSAHGVNLTMAIQATQNHPDWTPPEDPRLQEAALALQAYYEREIFNTNGGIRVDRLSREDAEAIGKHAMRDEIAAKAQQARLRKDLRLLNLDRFNISSDAATTAPTE